MGVLYYKWCYGFEILVQKPGYSVLAIKKNYNNRDANKQLVNSENWSLY